jgi:multidrug efflux pump
LLLFFKKADLPLNFSAPFIARPIATILLSIGLLLAGCVAYAFLPVSPLPNIDVPAMVVFANRPGADPATMANSVASPLERRLGEIGGVTELDSINSTGASTIIVLFDFGVNLEGASHDVQAAINAAQPDLPSDLPIRPFYRKINPAAAPIITLALSSDTLPKSAIYDAADTVIAQRLSQVEGVSQVDIQGGQTPAVRIQLDPGALRAAGLSAQDVALAIRSANVLEPTGNFEGPKRAEAITINGQIHRAEDYGRLVLKVHNGAVLRLSDVAHVEDSVSNVKLAAWNGRTPAIILNVKKIAGANVIQTVDRIRAMLPQLQQWISPEIHLSVLNDSTTTIRASISEVQRTLLITGLLVLMVILLFLRRLAATFAAAVTVPLSIAGTFAGMWAMGFSLNNYSLMAIVISVGFVVDDAIVMIENIARLREQGMAPLQAALLGSRQIGFTVVSISLSLVAVFIPLLFMGGILGTVFHEFAFTLTFAIAISAVISLTLTPMVCGRFVDRPPAGWLGRVDRTVEAVFRAVIGRYVSTIDWGLRRTKLMVAVTIGTVIMTFWLYGAVPKGFLSEQDTGLLRGTTIAAPGVSFDTMQQLQRRAVDVVLADPAVDTVSSNIGVNVGFDTQNRGTIEVALKPLSQRAGARAVIARLRPKLDAIAGLHTVMFAEQDIRGGGRQGGAEYEFDVLDSNLDELRTWSARLENRIAHLDGFTDVSSDQDKGAPQIKVEIDRQAASRLQVSVQAIDNALNNALAQRQVSTIYDERNQYKVVLETLPWLQQDPHFLDHIYIGANTGLQVPLSSVMHVRYGVAPLSIEHDGQIPSSSISFNLKPGFGLGDATKRAKAAAAELGMPPSVHTQFAANAKWAEQSLASEPALIGAALLSIYIVLGVLYESLIHPITIISSLPSAGLGALLAVLVTGTDFGVMSVVGIVLLMGIVKKNAIMLVDFALDAQRERGMSPRDAIREACVERFRPIIMTTLTAICGAMPLALSFGTGSEVRRPLGIAIVGGLIVSQALTLYTTPVIYLALERRARGVRHRIVHAPADPAPAE